MENEMRSAFELTQAVVLLMRERGGGRMVYISSGLSRHPSPGFIAHGSAKAALSQFVRYVAQEVGPDHITANVVAPGLIKTDATSHTPQEMKDRLASLTPMGRIGRPEDVAGAVAYFVSEEAGFVTGCYLPVNGGIQMD